MWVIVQETGDPLLHCHPEVDMKLFYLFFFFLLCVGAFVCVFFLSCFLCSGPFGPEVQKMFFTPGPKTQGPKP